MNKRAVPGGANDRSRGQATVSQNGVSPLAAVSSAPPVLSAGEFTAQQ